MYMRSVYTLYMSIYTEKERETDLILSMCVIVFNKITT